MCPPNLPGGRLYSMVSYLSTWVRAPVLLEYFIWIQRRVYFGCLLLTIHIWLFRSLIQVHCLDNNHNLDEWWLGINPRQRCPRHNEERYVWIHPRLRSRGTDPDKKHSFRRYFASYLASYLVGVSQKSVESRRLESGGCDFRAVCFTILSIEPYFWHRNS